MISRTVSIDGISSGAKGCRNIAWCFAIALLYSTVSTGCTKPDMSELSPKSDTIGRFLVYVGTSTSKQDEGIYAAWFDASSGTIESLGLVESILNPSFLALSPGGQALYAVSESDADGTVFAYQIDSETGGISEINRASTGGTGPAYVSIDQSGKWMLVANYGGGSTALLSLADDGSIEQLSDVVQHVGSGPNENRQRGPHAHFASFGPDNRFAYAVDLGTDRVLVYALDASAASLQGEDAIEVVLAPGSGPRHLAFHPTTHDAYVANELDGTVTAFHRDASTGGLTQFQKLSTLPTGFNGTSYSADIHVHPSGRWVYLSQRGDKNGIVVLEVSPTTGELSILDELNEGIVWPRNFTFDPTGAFLLVGNQRANNVSVIQVDHETGRLSSTGNSIEIPSPTRVLFVGERN